MKNILTLGIAFLLGLGAAFAQPAAIKAKGKPATKESGTASAAASSVIPQTAAYQVSIDLTQVREDKLMVEVILPQMSQEEAVYCMPKIVPGTYSIYDFGRFLSDFKAYNQAGELLEVKALDENRWQIQNAQSLYKISYWVEDTYDTRKGNFVFEPAGTNIEENKNFVINMHGFVGYIEGMKKNDYALSITKPEGFYGATSMQPFSSTPTADKFLIEDYMQLADAPLMYCKPDTTTFEVGGAEILISVYSPNKVLSSKFVRENITPILMAQKDYLGGTLPVSRYAFIIYLFEGFSGSGAMGALEHSYSSLYFLPEIAPDDLAQFIKDVAAHEFFHIITPLSIHSKEIHDFDYINPQMSKHLWLYEGCIEYFAGHVQVLSGLMSEEDYLNSVILPKIDEAKTFKDRLPFTVMSKGCLHEHKSQYQNVYAKGALIGMCLDIKMQQLSGGKYSLRQLMLDLSKEYGKDKPFDDDELLDKIIEVSGLPALRQFFTDYVEGEDPLPFQEIFQSVGLKYNVTETQQRLSLGLQFSLDESTGYFIIEDIKEEVNKDFQKGDLLVAIENTKITPANYRDVFEEVKQKNKEGDKVTIVIQRAVDGKRKEKKIKGKLVTVEDKIYLPLVQDEEASPEQLSLRALWLKGKTK